MTPLFVKKNIKLKKLKLSILQIMKMMKKNTRTKLTADMRGAGLILLIAMAIQNAKVLRTASTMKMNALTLTKWTVVHSSISALICCV